MIKLPEEYDNKEFLSYLDSRLRNCAPDRRPSDIHRTQLRMMLDHNFRFHRARLKVLSTFMVAVAVLFGAFRLTDVGSDAFDLNSDDTLIDGRPVAVAPFSEYRIMYPTAGQLLSEEELVELGAVFETQMSGQFDILNVRGWTIEGQTMFFVEYESQVAGKAVRYNYIPSFDDSQVARKFLGFFKSDQEAFLSRVNSGHIAIAGQATSVVSGREIQFVQYSEYHSKWGQIIYWYGEPFGASDSSIPPISK